MAKGYSQRFTLKDLFTNRELKNILPMFQVSRYLLASGDVTPTIKNPTTASLITETARKGGTKAFMHLQLDKLANSITLDGQLRENISHDNAVDIVYNEFLGMKSIMTLIANNGNLLKEAMQIQERNGNRTKLWLKPNSIQEIKGMSKQQLAYFVSDIMQNIYYSEDFTEVRKKYRLEDIKFGNKQDSLSYEQRQARWQNKVGL